jgi:predicted MFS family arabinose efflux permease
VLRTTLQIGRRTRLVVAVLFTGAFVMGCAEMLVVGMIDLIATDLAVSVPAAGALVTANALGLAIGGPLLTFATIRLDRRVVLVGNLFPGVPSAPDDRAAGQVRAALAPRVLAVLGLTILIFTAIQSALTYLVPFLSQVTGVSGPLVTAFLLAYGAATAIGSFGGGRFADRTLPVPWSEEDRLAGRRNGDRVRRGAGGCGHRRGRRRRRRGRRLGDQHPETGGRPGDPEHQRRG